MSIVKHKEFTEHIFRDILKKPMISEYYPECKGEEVRCNIQHIGRCRRLCYNCSGTKRIAYPIQSLYGLTNLCRVCDVIVKAYSARFYVSRTPEDIGTINKRSYPLIPLPKCDSCKYVEMWKRGIWKKYVEKTIRGGAKERKELRKIFYKKNERVAIRKLLEFFNCNTTIPMRDSLSGVIDYMYPA